MNDLVSPSPLTKVRQLLDSILQTEAPNFETVAAIVLPLIFIPHMAIQFFQSLATHLFQNFEGDCLRLLTPHSYRRNQN